MKDNDILDRKQLAGKKTYFLPVTWTYLSNGMNAYEQADYLSASIFFAVFTESILKDIVREGNLSNVKTDQELGGITISLKKYVLESSAPESKGNLSKNFHAPILWVAPGMKPAHSVASDQFQAGVLCLSGQMFPAGCYEGIFTVILVLTAKIVYFLGLQPDQKTDLWLSRLHHHLSSRLRQKDVQ